MTTKLKLSPIVAGCMKWGQWGSRFTTTDYSTMIATCAENNITSFDHADIYGDYTTEEEFGNALKNLSGIRQKIQLITKCGIKMPVSNRPAFKIKSYNTSKEYIKECAERSLLNLQTDYLDAFLIHRPDPLMDAVEIAEAFTILKKEGKVLHFGVSNFTPSQTSMLHHYFPVEINQIEISVLQLSPFHNGQLDQCLEKSILPMAWSPLGGGSLLSNESTDQHKKILTIAETLATKYKTSVENILLAFLHRHPSGIVPVLGTSKIERLLSANQFASIRLEAEEWFMLLEAAEGKEVP